LRLAQERNKELEKQLEASEKARSDAEAKAASAEDLRVRLNTAESALSEREEQISKREAAIIARLDTQSIRFSSNVPFPFRRPLLFDYITFIFILKDSTFLFSRKNWRDVHPEPRSGRGCPPGYPLGIGDELHFGARLLAGGASCT
jgi:hypothetical protein